MKNTHRNIIYLFLLLLAFVSTGFAVNVRIANGTWWQASAVAVNTAETAAGTGSPTLGMADTVRVRHIVKPEIEHPEEYGLDLDDPENIKADTAEYDVRTGYYRVGTKLGDSFLNAPVLMTPEEYMKWTERKQINAYFKQRNDSLVITKGKSKFDFTDMHFDLGPAEKIFGPGGVQIKTQGSAELKIGYNYKFTDNPALSERNRTTHSFDFDEKINISVNAKVGDKMDFNINYNTDATFDFDTRNLKLSYEGKEDEIVKLLEAGNVSFPSKSSLVRGATSLFGIRTDLQFGKLNLQAVVSQKKSQSKSVSSQGGSQLTTFDIQAYNYDENRHFFLAHWFRDNYDRWCSTLPTVTSGVTIKRVEVWITNTNGTTTNTRNILGFADLAEHDSIGNDHWFASGTVQPQNSSNDLYKTLVNDLAEARNIDKSSEVLDVYMSGGRDYEKTENARLLSSNEYTLNTHLGYISLKTALKSNQAVAVAFEYTYGGNTYQVGEFSSDINDNEQAVFVKLLKATNNAPSVNTWHLMMKNVYALKAQSVQREKFKLDVKYLCDTTGVYQSFLPEQGQMFKDYTILQLLNADRLDDNNRTNPNGRYDFIEGYTVLPQTGMIIFPVVEPFGDWLRKKIGNQTIADKYCYDALYDTTKTAAKQVAEKNKFSLTGEFKASSGSEIDLGSTNIPQGSVVVSAGGVTLTEGSDYTVDYSLGRVTIINQSIIDAGTNVSVSMESQSEYASMRKTMLGLNWSYDFSKDLQIGGTFMSLSEKPLVSKVGMGEEPLNNMIWGFNINWKQKSQWLTNLIDKLPLIEATAPSNISFTAEVAQLIARNSSEVQGSASYLDDFENTKNGIDVSSPHEWMLSSAPVTSSPELFPEAKLSNNIDYGKNRALLAWYNIDPLFTRRNSSLTPSHIKSDLNQLSNHYVREVFVREIYPNRDTNSGESNTLDVLNVAYYPEERGPYNLDTDVNPDKSGHLNNPEKRWGGMMRKLDTSDFETSNVQYIEFWMLDPFIYTKDSLNAGGDLYFNLGDISEDVLKDGLKAYESGLPVNEQSRYTENEWGRMPNEKSVVYSFSNEAGARERQDLGFNGLSSVDERNYKHYQEYLKTMQTLVRPEVYDSLFEDPAGDNYHYFRGSDFDARETSILERYKRINGLEGNSPYSSQSGESYSTAYKTTPDCEDINLDYTMNEYENFYQYRVELRPGELENHKWVKDVRHTNVSLRNGQTERADWYLFRIPVDDYDSKEGNIGDFSSVRFMRMFLTNFKQPVVLRFASLDLVRGEWRTYDQMLFTGDKPSVSGRITTAAVNIEENNDKSPVNYVLPPGITRVLDPQQPQLTQANEQALSITVSDLASGDARAVYKTTNVDLRQYRHLQMFIHANALEGQESQLDDKQMSVFVRLGSDYKNNYYEYEIPMTLTPAGHYDTYTAQGCEAVWPSENMLDIDFSLLTDVKHQRNLMRARGAASYMTLYSQYDPDRPNNKVSVMGNPSLGEVKTMMIGVRNNGRKTGSVEVWVNELRMQDYTNDGGWAAQGNLNVQMSDIGTVNLTGHLETAGFGGLEDKVSARRNDNLYEWGITTQLELGRLFPEKWKMSLPFYYSYQWQKLSPKYNPFDTDVLLSDALDECANETQRDSLRSLTQSKQTNSNISLSNWKSNWVSRKPMPYDPANFSLSYSHSRRFKEGQTIVYENEESWRGSLQYAYSPKYKTWEPFKKMKGKSKWLDIIKAQNLNWLPQNISFNTDIARTYYEYQERDLESSMRIKPTFSSQFLWNRELSIRWDIFKSLKLSYTSATHAEVEEPNVIVNKDLYPDEYTAWKDSIKRSLLSFGRPLRYNSTFNASYQVPLNKIPALDWLSADGSYNSNYSWTRGTELEDGTSLGHTAATQRTINVNGKINFETLYKKSKFLSDVEKRFSAANRSKQITARKKELEAKRKAAAKKEAEVAKKKAEAAAKKGAKDGTADAEAEALKANKKKDEKPAVAQEKKKPLKSITKELTLNDSTYTDFAHGQKSKRIIVRAKDAKGKEYNLRYSKVDDNTIRIKNRDSVAVKVSVTVKQPLEEQSWYKTAQVLARGLMMIRNASVTYRNTYALTLPGFRTEIGDAFGQKRANALLSPGLDFAFGMVGDSYIDKAARNGWLMQNDSNVTSPATTNSMEDLQIKIALEPVPDLKIDLNASRTVNRAKSIQFMYEGMPTTISGSYNMTTVAIATAFSSSGDINNNYNSASFNRFLENLPIMQSRVRSRYVGARYPAGVGSDLAGKPFDPANGDVNKYGADVMIPAFLAAYTGRSALRSPLDIFPSLLHLLPNWTIRYSGLSKIPWFATKFKSFNINHAYKCVYSVGAYNSYTNFMEYMGDLGFIADVKSGNPIPNSIYNVSTVSINESFSPLIGVDMTFMNGLTAKAEYKKTRTLNLSMTSVALTENFSNDIVIGFGYKIKDLNLFGAKRIQSDEPRSKKRKSKSKSKNASGEAEQKSSSSSSNKRVGGISHDLNIRADFSYRMQNALNRNIMTAVTTGTSGNTAYKLAINADYTFSKLLTLSAFMDWQKNTPLVSTSSYPTITADFGINIKFSLTR